MDFIHRLRSCVIPCPRPSQKKQDAVVELKNQIDRIAIENFDFDKSELAPPRRQEIARLVTDRLGEHRRNKALVDHLVGYAEGRVPTMLEYGVTLQTNDKRRGNVNLLRSPSLRHGHIELGETIELARGNFGTVYSGAMYFQEDGSSEPAALKVNEDKAHLEKAMLRAWNDVNSPYLVKYHCSTVAGGQAHFFMEECEQRSSHFVSKLRSTPDEDLPWVAKEKIMRSLAAQLLQGIRALHQHEIKHLDIKPENVMLSYDGALKIIDAGFATRDPSIAKACGTLRYMAPELRSKERAGIDLKKCDLYSAGVTIRTLLHLAGFEDENPLHGLANALCTDNPEERVAADDFLTDTSLADIYRPDELSRLLFQHKLISGGKAQMRA